MSTPMPRVVQELARVFHDRDQAVLLLQRSSFPTPLIPEFRTSLSFWTSVAETARNGALPNGIRPILDEAAKLYPSNALFGPKQARGLAAWDPTTTAYLLASPGVSPTLRVLPPSDGGSATRIDTDRSQWLITLHFQWIGSSSTTTTSLGTVSLLAIITTITALAVKMLSQDPLATNSDRSTRERTDDTPTEGRARRETEPLDPSARPNEHAANTPSSKLGKKKQEKRKRRARSGRNKVDRERSIPMPEDKSWDYSIYNCIVGPDETNEATERSAKRPNQKGQCYWDDRRIFLAPPTSPAASREAPPTQ